MTLGLLLAVLSVLCDAVAPACLNVSCGFTRRWATSGISLFIPGDRTDLGLAAVRVGLMDLVWPVDGSGDRPGCDVFRRAARLASFLRTCVDRRGARPGRIKANHLVAIAH